MKSVDDIKKDIEAKVGGAVTLEGSGFLIPKEKLLEISRFLGSDVQYQMDYVSNLSCTDYKEYLEVVYHFYSVRKKQGPIVLKVRADRNEAKIPSLTPHWRGAEYQEREAYDLLGVHFEGHPDLRRILMWEGFEHFPLRKDYVADDQDRAAEKT